MDLEDRPNELGRHFLNEVHSEEDLLRKMDHWATQRMAALPFTKLLDSPAGSRRVIHDHMDPIPDSVEELTRFAINQLKEKYDSLKTLAKQHDVIEMVNLKALENIEQQLNNEAVFLSILGRYNSGKTTLINALLGIDVLPVSDRPETATTLYIQNHTETTYESDVQLIYHNNIEASGLEGVRDHLENIHSGIRRKSQMMVDSYILKVNCSAIASVKPKAYIVDTPGSNEVGEVQLQELADIVLKTASAYMYVMTYSDIKNKEDYNALKSIYERDKDIFFSERLTIVVTHYDRYFEGGKTNSIPKEEIQRIVASTIESEIGAKVSPKIVFPISGKWACKARAYIRTHSSSDFGEVEFSLMNILRAEHGSNVSSRECLDMIEKMGKDKAVGKLLETSGIEILEKRIKSITQRLSDIWKRNLVIGCIEFLETAIKVLRRTESSINGTIKNTEDRVNSAMQVVEYHKSMIENVRRDSPVYANIRKAFDHDTSYEKRFSVKVEAMLNDFKRVIIGNRKEKRKYSMSDIDHDVNNFSENAEQQMKHFFQQMKFLNCQRLLRNYIEQVSEKFGRLRSAASLAMEPGVKPQSISRILRSHELNGTDEEELSTTLEGLSNTLGEIDLSSFVNLTIRRRIALWVAPWPIKIEVVKDDDIHQIIQDRRSRLKELHADITESIRPNVMMYFFKAYCTIVVRELGIFNTQYERDKAQVFELLHTQKTKMADHLSNRENIGSIVCQFQQLQKKLQSLKI